MKCNIGKIDRVLRVLVGAGLAVWAFSGGPVWAWVGMVPLVTGIAGICPAYRLMRINTCAVEK